MSYNGNQSYGDKSAGGYGDQLAGGYDDQSDYVDNSAEWDDTPNSYYQQDNQPRPYNRGRKNYSLTKKSLKAIE